MRNLFILILVILVTGCNSNDTGNGNQNERAERNAKNWSELPVEVRIDSLKNTEFVPTLESKIEQGKNIVYAAAMLYAWDEFRKIGGMISVPSSASEDLKKLNSSQSHKNTLDKGEYSAAGEIVDGMIEVRAFFNKTLPFASELHATDPILFGTDTVRAFGVRSYSREIDDQVEILYYRSDSQFVLALYPADSAHEIIIAMGIPKVQTLNEVIPKIKASVRAGESEKKQTAKAWRYQFGSEDVISVPELRFNVSKHYKNLEGQTITTGSVDRQIAVAYQRTALVLNRYGAVVESEAEITTTATDTSAVLPKPKSMICNRPFYIIIQHKGRQNPYFVMKVEDSELMTKD